MSDPNIPVVTSSDSATEVSAEIPPAETAPVTAETGEPDRPWQNVVGEMTRKFGRLERQLDFLASRLSESPAPSPKSGGATRNELSDEDLWNLARQGERDAFDLYMQRIASRTAQTQSAGDRIERLVDAQLSTLGQKYPVLNDTSHPLTQTVQLAYQLLLGQGYPASKATMLEAIKTGIADRPDLVAELHAGGSRGRETVRQSAATVAQAGQNPPTARAASPTPARATVRPLTEKERELAQRIGVKDPQKAKEAFLQRQKEGKSALGAVAGFIKEEDL